MELHRAATAFQSAPALGKAASDGPSSRHAANKLPEDQSDSFSSSQPASMTPKSRFGFALGGLEIPLACCLACCCLPFLPIALLIGGGLALAKAAGGGGGE